MVCGLFCHRFHGQTGLRHAVHRIEPSQGRLGRSQGSKALTVSKDPFHGRVIAFDEVVAPLFVDMPDAVKMWVIATILDRSIHGRSVDYYATLFQ